VIIFFESGIKKWSFNWETMEVLLVMNMKLLTLEIRERPLPYL
jgi:hypothetical protein